MKNPSQIGENWALRDKMCPKSVKMEGTDFLRSLDASAHSGLVILSAFWPENGRPGGDLGSQAGRQVG